MVLAAIRSDRQQKFYRSADEGRSWIRLDAAVVSARVRAIAFDDDDRIYVGTDNGIASSTNEGNSWKEQVSVQDGIRSLLVSRTRAVVAGSNGNGIFRSSDEGDSWRHVAPTGIVSSSHVYSI